MPDTEAAKRRQKLTQLIETRGLEAKRPSWRPRLPTSAARPGSIHRRSKQNPRANSSRFGRNCSNCETYHPEKPERTVPGNCEHRGGDGERHQNGKRAVNFTREASAPALRSIGRAKPGIAAPAPSRAAVDFAMMARCIELSRVAAGKGEYPFGTVIARDGRIVAEAINTTNREGDVSRHAEVIALSQALPAIGREQLRRCTLYSSIEPCAMCAYCIREAWVGRVVYALGSPVMGGLSKWNILRDDGLSDRIPEVFGAVPEVVSGLLLREAQQAWRDWSPFTWEMIKLRGLLTAPCPQDGHVHVQPAHNRSLWHYLCILFMRNGPARHRGGSLAERLYEP